MRQAILASKVRWVAQLFLTCAIGFLGVGMPALCPRLADGAEPTGTLKGTVSHSSIPKYPAVVHLEPVEARSFDRPTEKALMDQRKLTFIPHVLPIVKGTTVTFKNSDTVSHNIFTPDGERFNLGSWTPGIKKERKFDRTGVYRLLCNKHAEMLAYVVVVPTPLFSLTSTEDGSFEISDIPAGKYRLKVWGKKFRRKSLAKVSLLTVPAGKTIKVRINR